MIKKKTIILIAISAICAGALFGYSAFALNDVSVCTVGSTNGNTPEKYCAGSLYRQYEDVRINCKDSVNATVEGCQSAVKARLVCSAGIQSQACEGAKSTYSESVSSLIMYHSVSPCGITGDGMSHFNECIKIDNNWKWYFATDPSDSGGSGGDSGGANSDTDICKSVKPSVKNSDYYKMYCGGAKGETQAQDVVIGVLKTVFTWTGILAVIVIIIGAVFYMTSEGDPGKVAKAKNAILYAIIGLIVSLSAFAIVNFVLSRIGA